MIPKSRRWFCTSPVLNGRESSIEVRAPTRYLARLVCAERLGIPFLWTHRIRCHPIKEGQTK